MAAKFRPEHLDRRHNLRDLDIHGRIILTLRLLMSYIWSTYS